MLTGDHRVVGDEVQRPLLRRADAEGRRRLCHPLGVGNGRTLPLRRLGSRPSAWLAVGAHRLQRVVRESEQPRGFAPEAQVPPFQGVPGLHGNVAVTEIVVDAEPRRPPKLPCAGRQDQDGAGTPPGAVLRYGPQPVVERPATQGEALAHHAEAAAVVERDGGVEAPPPVELHAGPEPVDAGGHRSG